MRLALALISTALLAPLTGFAQDAADTVVPEAVTTAGMMALTPAALAAQAARDAIRPVPFGLNSWQSRPALRP